MKILLRHVDKFGTLSDPGKEAQKRMERLLGNELISRTIANDVKQLSSEESIKVTYEHRSQFQVPDSCFYFFERVDALAVPDYVPQDADLLRCRITTTGIDESEFQIGDTQFKLLDVGGQRNERKKWIHCFENVTGVLFVAAMNEYDQVLYEDEKTNRMDEALKLFAEVCNSRWFRTTAVILFLNKRDLFGEKIKYVPLSLSFPNYVGPNSYEFGCNFLRNLFKSQSKKKDATIYIHITCATDKDNVVTVFGVVKDIITRKVLLNQGLL